MADNMTLAQGLAAMATAIANHIEKIQGTMVNPVAIADILLALTNGPKTMAVLQGWIDEEKGKFKKGP
jgi:hypothetical protein